MPLKLLPASFWLLCSATKRVLKHLLEVEEANFLQRLNIFYYLFDVCIVKRNVSFLFILKILLPLVNYLNNIWLCMDKSINQATK